MDVPRCIEAALSTDDLTVDELRAIISYYANKNLSKEIELLLKGKYNHLYDEAKQLTLENSKFTCASMKRFCNNSCNLSDFQRVINEIEDVLLLKRSGVLIVKIRGETWTVELEKLFTDSGRVTMKDFIVWYAKTFGKTVQLIRSNKKNMQIDQHAELLNYMLSIAEKVEDASDVEMVAEEILNRICSMYAEKFDGKTVADVLYRGNELLVSTKLIDLELRRLKTNVTLRKLAGHLSSRGIRDKKTKIVRIQDKVFRYWSFNINALKALGYTPMIVEDEEDEEVEFIEEEIDWRPGDGENDQAG